MPTYPYICGCGHKEDVIKSMMECASPETCSICDSPMEKDWGEFRPAAVHAYAGHFNHSLGAYIGNKSQENDACARIEDKTGSRPVAIGDWVPPHKPKIESYDLPRGFLEGSNG